MLIIPFASKMTLKPVPWVTIALVLINTVILFAIQSGDDEKYDRTISVYSDSVLPELEAPAFAAFLEQEGRLDEAESIRLMPPKQLGRSYFPIMLQREGKFISQLHRNKWITPDNPQFEGWKAKRTEFEDSLSGIVTEEYSFKPDAPEAVDMFTHMFLHGGFDHLLGNMVFLFLLGFVVERLIGPLFYGLVYIVGGLCAVASFALVSADSGTSLVGASGAIGALMGIYVALFGWRKIPFFYSLGFYFDYVKAPALLLLVAFLGKELYFHFMADDNVAYMAHFGGIAFGALAGFFLTRMMHIPVDEMLAELETDERTHVKPWQDEFDAAMGYVEKLQFAKARELFAALHERYPQEAVLLHEWYKTERNVPAGDDYHAVARKIMLHTPADKEAVRQLHEVYREYLSLAKPRPKMDRELVFSLASTFAERGLIADGEKLARLLIKQAPQDASLAPLALLVARRLRQSRQQEQADSYLKWILKVASEPAIVKQARLLLSSTAAE